MLQQKLIRAVVLSGLVAAVSFVVACGGGGEDKPAATLAPGAPAVIDQDNLKFNPTSLTVSSGETVAFKNSETTVHTVTINGKNESGTMKKGALFEWTAPATGTYKITCDYHPQMKANITVN